jgi:hypothetical protein
MASIRVDMDCMTGESKPWSVRQPNTAPNIVLNPPLVENHPLSKLSGFYPFSSLNWNMSNLFHFICDFF